MSLDIDGTAVVTGASTGIGEAAAKRFAAEGANVVVADVKAEDGEATAADIRDAGGEATFVETDVSDPEDVQSMVDAAVDTYGGLDYAFNNAGIDGERAPTADQPLDNWERVVGVNLKGVFLGMRAEIPAMLDDGGGAVVVVSPEVAADLDRECPTVEGQAEAAKHVEGGHLDVTYTAAVESGPRAFAEAGIDHDDVDYASIYDSFTITVLETIEDLGFCAKGEGGAFVEGGTLQAPDGDLPFNTDGGGLCNNHPGNRGGMTKIIEAVRQLRGEANDPVQVPDCEVAIAHGTGGSIGTRMGSCTLVLGADR